ncbi:hypothetical protein PQR02_25190, partial [Paraburkholderia sediminicola]
VMMDLNRGSVSEIHGDDDFARWAKNNRGNLLQSFNDSDRQGGRDAHWPKADEALDKLIAGNQTTSYGYKNLLSDQRIPVRELFNYTRSRDSDYQLKYGNLTAGAGDKDEAGIASQYRAVNVNNARWADQTEIFGAAQRNWKSAKGLWGKTFSYLPIVGGVGDIVFGIHDGLHGMTEQDRIGGNVAAAISGLQLVHDVVPGAAESTFGKPPSVLNSSSIHDSGWKFNPGMSEFKFTPLQRVNGQVGYPLGPIEPPKIPSAEGTEKNIANAGNQSPQLGLSGIKRPAPSGDDASGPVDTTEASPHTKISRPDSNPGTTASSSNSSTSKASPSSQSHGNAKKFSPVTAVHVNEWHAMSQIGRNRIGMSGFASKHKLSLASWRNAVAADGMIKPQGQAILDRATGVQYSPVTADRINEWHAMPQAERNRIGMAEFACNNKLRFSSWRNAVAADGTIRPLGQAILDHATGVQYRFVTADHINEWHAMSQTERNRIGMSGFASNHKLSLASWESSVAADGTIRPQGQAVLDRATGVQYSPVTADRINEWHAMPQAERTKIGMAEFARDNKLSFNSWKSSVAADGTIRPLGQAILDRATGVQYSPVTADHIIEWHAMPQMERYRIGMSGFASNHKLSFNSWQDVVAGDGTIRPRGQAILDHATGVQYRFVTADHINEWHAMSQMERNRIGMSGFASNHKLSFNSWRNAVAADGTIRPQGQAVLDRATGVQYSPVTADHINQWHAMPQAERTKIGMAEFARNNKLRFNNWRNAVAADGTIKQYGQLVLNRKLKEGPSVGEDVAIKTEPDDPGFIRHEIEDNGPILRDPADPTRSVLQEAEGTIDSIAVTRWAELRDELAKLPASEQKRVKQEILREVHEWLKSEGNHKGKFEDLVDLSIPLDDGPYRGMSVYARRDIRQFEVIGPYAGVLHDTDASLGEEMAKLGDENVLTYLWATNSGQRSVSAFTHGNTLSLINTGRLPGVSAEVPPKENNLGAIRVGKNLTFYVALKEIKAGDELFVSYGEEYNPSGSWPAASEPVSDS